jgi:hypothetical protein
MGNEIITALKMKLASMQKIEAAGFIDQVKAATYFKEKEMILEEISKALEAVQEAEASELMALKETVKALRGELKGQAANPRELTRRELCYRLGKGLAAAWAGNNPALAELSFSPNLKADNWTNPHDVSWVRRDGMLRNGLPWDRLWGIWRLTISILSIRFMKRRLCRTLLKNR